MVRHTFTAAISGAFATMLLAGCAGMNDAIDDDGPTSVTFHCDDERSFLALFSEDRRTAFVETGDETYELVMVDRDGDEMDYANSDDVQLTIDGDDGHLRVPEDDDFEDCST